HPGKRFNVMFMGTGEPLLNMENLCAAIELLNATEAFALGEKRITVSTIGFPDRIYALSKSPLKFSLAVSLNAVDEGLRKKIMPHSHGLTETLEAAERFAEARETRATLEYVLLAGVNDRPEDAGKLSALTAGRPFKINLIPFNEWKGSGFRRPSEQRIEDFVNRLLPKAPTVTVRRSRGRDINAACGQLKLCRKKKPY
ncbi:MAG: radical SAM protein, partial [Candidatus Krumholzibacteria bacterium]|nr:radical SAM protein [Candidatus Krumholzibacteria bacterium]